MTEEEEKYTHESINNAITALGIMLNDAMKDALNTIYCYDEEEAQRCEKWLNNLHNQNQKLKEENEQLKQEIIVYKKAFQQQVQRCTL